MDIVKWANDIGKHNEYARKWLGYFNKNITLENKIDWTINDIIDLQDYNKMKNNINIVLLALKKQGLSISQVNHQNLTDAKITAIKRKINEYQDWIGGSQEKYNVCGITTCGKELKI